MLNHLAKRRQEAFADFLQNLDWNPTKNQLEEIIKIFASGFDYGASARQNKAFRAADKYYSSEVALIMTGILPEEEVSEIMSTIFARLEEDGFLL